MKECEYLSPEAYVCLYGEWQRTGWFKRLLGYPGLYRLNKWCIGHVVVRTEKQWRFSL